MHILYFIYSFLAGIFSYYIFKTDLLTLLLFLIVFEMSIYLIFLKYKIIWTFHERIFFNILFFLGYFSFYLIYSDYNNNDYIHYQDDIF